MRLNTFKRDKDSVYFMFFKSPSVIFNSTSVEGFSTKQYVLALCIDSKDLFNINKDSDLFDYLKLVHLNDKIRELSRNKEFNTIICTTPNIDNVADRYRSTIYSVLDSPEIEFKGIFDLYEEFVKEIKKLEDQNLDYHSSVSHNTIYGKFSELRGRSLGDSSITESNKFKD